MRDPAKLRAFELADTLALFVYRTTVGFPSHERFGLTSQMRRAAVSIACNIVEGCARRSKLDYLRFLEIAYASAREVEYLITVTERLDYLSPNTSHELQDHAAETSKVLHGLIQALRGQ